MNTVHTQQTDIVAFASRIATFSFFLCDGIKQQILEEAPFIISEIMKWFLSIKQVSNQCAQTLELRQ